MYLMKINFNKFKLFYFNRNSVIFRRNQISLLTSSVEYYLRRRQKRIGFFRQNSISFVPSGGGVVFSPFSDACFLCALYAYGLCVIVRFRVVMKTTLPARTPK